MRTKEVLEIECLCERKYEVYWNVQCHCGRMLIVDENDARKPQPAPQPINEPKRSAA